MFATRKEVDEHVHKMFAKIPPGPERDLKGWAVGRMYCKIQEYSKAIEHLNSFLKVNDDAGAHKLIALCYKQLKQPDYEKSLDHYQRSIQLNSKQPDVIKDCCKMLVEQKSHCNPNRVSYWLELANNVEDLKDSELVLALRMRLSTDKADTTDLGNSMELVIQKALLARPYNTMLQLRLLQTYLKSGRIDEAFNYAYKTEMEMPAQSQSSEWYDAVLKTVEEYRTSDSSKDWTYWQLLFLTIDRLLHLNLLSNTSKSLSESIALLFKMDQYVFEFSSVGDNLLICGGRELHKCCLHHYSGQFLLHSATVLFKRELVGNKSKWFTTVRTTLPLLLLGYQKRPTERKSSSYWQRHCNSAQQKLLDLWRHQSAFRCSQLGRTLYGCLLTQKSDCPQSALQGLWTNSDELLVTVRQYCADSQWRSELYQQLFTHPADKLMEHSSQFIRDPRLQQPLYEWPSVRDIEEYEQEALQLHPPTLEHHVYLALNAENLAEAPRVHFYKSFRRDYKKSLSNCSVDTLSQVDIDIFLYAVVLQAQRKLLVQRERYNSCHVGNRIETALPFMLPFANMMARGDLITSEQNEWWTVVQRIHDNINMGDTYQIEHRAQLQFGLEVVRCQNEPHMDIILALKLGHLLAHRVDASHLEQRIEAFYKLGINMMKRSQAHKLEPFYRYFTYSNATASYVWPEIIILAEEALSYLSKRSIKMGNIQEFVKDVNGLQLPMATYLQAESYRQLADASNVSRIARQHFQERRLECLKETKTLLADSHDHPLNSIVQRELKVLLDDDHYASPDLHNNSSAYEDAEDDFNSCARNIFNRSYNRSRRPMETHTSANTQLEQSVKEMSKQLCYLKEEIGGGIDAIRTEFKTLSDKFDMLEEQLKKWKLAGTCNHETQSREGDAAAAAAALGLDEFLNMDDAIQSNLLNNVPTQDRYYSSTTNAPNPTYNTPMINQNQMYNYFASQAQFMRPPPTANNMPHNFYAQRPPVPFGMPPNIYQNPAGAQFMDGINYGMIPAPPTLIIPQVSQAHFGQTQVSSNAPVGQNANASFFNGTQLTTAPTQISHQAAQPSQNIPTHSNSVAQQKLISTTALTLPQSVPSSGLMFASATSSSTSTTISAASSASTTVFNRALNNQPVEKEPPANVVITSSDPLPKTAIANTQPTLSVTIPPQHIKPSLVHTTESSAVASTDLNFNLGNNNPSSIFSGLSASTFSFKTQVAQAAAEKQKECAAETVNDSVGNNSSTGNGGDGSAELDYDPRPDFKGIIPLPDEVEVRTGEEDEVVKFSHRAKLFRHIDKEWKERGIGIIKILKNQKTGCTRILMRREQTHKICANHKITSGMTLAVPEQDKEEKSFIWVANDFADENLKLEKFLVRFKLANIANDFKLAFEQATKNYTTSEIVPSTVGSAKTDNVSSFVTSTPANAMTKQVDQVGDSEPPKGDGIMPKTLFGNLSDTKNAAKGSPFANFNFATSLKTTNPSVSQSFGSISAATDTIPTSNKAFPTGFNFGTTQFFNKPGTALENTQLTTSQPKSNVKHSNDSDLDANDEYVSTAQFDPVIPLPELVDVVTGEEDEIVLFEHRAKLLRFEKETNEWKERGLGNMKLLRQKTDPSIVRLLMRREQVHKICCNQRLFVDTKFTYAKNSQNALTWAGQDFAHEEPTTEMLCVRFKTSETCKAFYDAICDAQSVMLKSKTPDSQSEKLTQNLKHDPETKFQGFGDAFKPKAGSWNCQSCYTNNDATQQYCVACETPKDDTVPPKPSLGQSGALNLSSSGGKFTFGFGNSTPTFSFGVKESLEKKEKPAIELVANTANSVPAISFSDGLTKKVSSLNQVTTETVGFGDAFKPKKGSWNCNDCYTQNEASQLYCAACQNPKDESVPKKDNKNQLEGVSLQNSSTPLTKFNFGFGAQRTSSTKLPTAVPNTMENKSNENNAFASPNFSLNPMTVTNTSLSSKKFTFSMPKSQQQSKSPTGNVGGVDVSNDDESNLDEEENTSYFAPVIPLPDKVEVKTGEEDEFVLYAQRAKLYRLAESTEWKERGLGIVKILRHKETNNLRVLMRREQVLKICLNHVLSANVIYKPKDEKTCFFAVHDFSDGKSVLERFALRFKTAEIAKGFLNAVESALAGTAQPITEEEGQQNEELIAPNTKLNIDKTDELTKLACSGCRGCEPENFDYGHPQKIEEPLSSLPLTLPALKLPIQKEPQQSNVQQVDVEPKRCVLKASTLTSNITNKSGGLGALNNVSTATTDGFPKLTEKTTGERGTGFFFGNTQNPFEQNTLLFANNVDKPQQYIFGSLGGVDNKFGNQSKSIFGTSSIEQPGNRNEAQKSIFMSFGDKSSTGDNLSCFTGPAVSVSNNESMEKTISSSDIPKGDDQIKHNENSGVDIEAKSTDQPALNCFTDLPVKAGDDFASLAAKGTSNPIGFQKSETGGQKSIFMSFGDKSSTGHNFSCFTGQAVSVSNNESMEKNISSADVPKGNDQIKRNENSGVDIEAKSTDQPALNCFSDIAAKVGDDFASLAAKGNSNPIGFQKSETGGFFGLTHQDEFKNFKSPIKDHESAQDMKEDDNYDPHYAPIIALPNEIVVTTGEENEVKLFGERATLFRYDSDSREWKERGVGELKILKHNTLNTYRMILRREQIHKLVLNMKIGESFFLEYMNGQKKSFIWANFNYAESSDGVMERLACRFKKQEIADEFHEIVKNCIADAKGLQTDETIQFKDETGQT